MYVYIEYLLIENAIINYIILYVTKRFTRTDTSKIRMLIATLIGTIYTLVVFFPSFRFMTKFVVKLSISILMIILAFNPKKVKQFIKLLSTFYIVSFVFAGAMLALFYFTNNKIFSFRINDFSIQLLIIGIIVSYLLVKYVFSHIYVKLNKDEVYVPLIIKLNDKKANIVALIDTGNSLKEPITQTPVIIVEFSAIKNILPNNIQNIFINNDNNLDLDLISNAILENKEKIPLRLIPFKSIGKENGVLLGFKPNEIVINNEKFEKKRVKDVIIGIYNNKLCEDDKYKALLHPEVFY